MNRINYPQSYAEKISANINQIAKNGCLAMCYLYCLGIDPDYFIGILSDAMNEPLSSGIGKDCYVNDAERFCRYISGHNFAITKEDIPLKKITGPYPVRYSYNGKSHWVVVKSGKIVFNSLQKSVCVENGKPVNLPAPDGPAVRVMTLKKR